MMCDNLSVYKSFAPPTHLPEHADDSEHRPSAGTKRKLSDYEEAEASKTIVESDESDDEDVDDEDDDDEDDDDDDAASSDDEEAMSDDDLRPAPTRASTLVSSPSTIIHRRHSDTIQPTYGTPIVKRRCTYSSMHDDEQKRSMLVESYRKLRGVKKPKLQVSLLICNLIKRLEKTFSKSPPLPHDEHEPDPVQYYQPARTAYRSSSSDSLYMSPLSSTLVNDELDSTNQQYSPAHAPAYDSDKVSLSGAPSMYHTPTTDAYWLAQSNFAVPVVSTSDEDDADVSLHGGGDYLDLSDHTLSSSFSSAGSPSSSSAASGDCCCSSTSSSTTTTTTTTKHLVDTNNNMSGNDDYFVYHHHHHQHATSNGQTFFYSHNGTNTVDIITTA